MGLLDKFLSALKLNDDYEDDDEFLDDDDFEEEVKPAKKSSFFRKSADKDDFDDFDDFDREYDNEPIIRRTLNKKSTTDKPPVKAPKAANPAPASKPASGTSKISSIRSKRNGNDMSLCVVKPKSMEDAREITETLVRNCTVVLNLEGLDIDLAQRIVDFTSGSIYALNGGLQRVNNTIFIITPQNVDISGDITDLLNGAFDIPSMNFNY